MGPMTNQKPTTAFRLFVAIPLPEPVRNEIVRVQQELQTLVPRAVVRWARSDQFHLTLRFLGDVPTNKIESLKQTVGTVCQAAPSLSLHAAGIGFFPNPRSPRVVWVGIDDGPGRLTDLQRRIEASVQPFSSEPGEKNFTGHITLGRLKNARPADTRDLAARAQALASRIFGDWTAEDVEIIRSELSPSGSRYTSLAVCRFGGVGGSVSSL